MHNRTTEDGPRRARALVVTGLALSLVWPLASGARAQSATLDAFSPSETSRGGFATSSAEDQGHLRFGVQLYLDYANDPLVYESDAGNPDSESRQIVAHHLVGHLGVSLGLADRLVLFAGLPASLVMEGDDVGGLPGVSPADGTQLGDAFVGARVRLFGERVFLLAVQARVSFPTADLVTDGQAYAGEASITVHPELLAQINAGRRLRILANVGYRVRENQRFLNVEVGDQLTYGLGLLIGVTEGLDALVEVHGASTVQAFFEREETPLELLAGLKYRSPGGFVGGVGAGPGLVRGFGSPDVRALATLGYTTPEPREQPDVRDTDGDGLLDTMDACPNDAEDVGGVEDTDGCPDLDDDRDGIADVEDVCRGEPEDVDQFEDADGCPDADNDADGVPDASDTCPVTAEDRDGFEDENGCPDPDNDADGVLDGVDACPLVVGVPQAQGCPLPDRDGDGVLDAIDNCPEEPGTVENHGCRERQLVQISSTQLEILDNVYFRTNRDIIESRSFNLLDDVARVLVAHPEITRIRVEGHTDARGSRARNVRLSEARARAVLRYLTTHGVDASRLTAIGFGPDRPIVENARTPEDHARNRRVEFHIENAGEGTPVPTPAPSVPVTP